MFLAGIGGEGGLPRKSPHRLRRFRKRWSLLGLLQIHHIIPRQCSDHPILLGYDMEGPSNLMFLPTREGVSKMKLRETVPIHDGGHVKYNIYVRSVLDGLYEEKRRYGWDDEKTNMDVVLLAQRLRRDIKTGDVPW